MGYCTAHKLSVTDLQQETQFPMIAQLFRVENDDAKYALEEDGGTGEECKWYDADRDLKDFSKKHPNKLFILSGEGEDSGDIWTNYYVNGKVQQTKAVITFDDFNMNKLK